jgi:enoyl-CoA hydratase
MVEIVLSGPGKNALSTELMTRVITEVRAAGSEPLLIRGEGDAFSAGLNLKELATLDDAGIERFLGLLDDMVVALFNHPAPTIACVNGHAIAGGCVVALTCDHRVLTTSPKARVGLNEVAIGLRFPPRILKLARARLGPLHERRVLLEAGVYPPAEALALGLCDELADDPVAAGHARLARWAAHDRGAFAAAKAAITRGALALPSDAGPDGRELDPDESRRYREEVLQHWTGPAFKKKIASVLGSPKPERG